MDKNQILDYVMDSPGNTNRAVLSGMLDQMAGGDSGGGGLNLVPHHLMLRFVEKQTVGAKHTIEATPENSFFKDPNDNLVDPYGKIIVPLAFGPGVTGIDFVPPGSGIEIDEFTGELTYRFRFTNNTDSEFEFTKNDSLMYAIGYYADDQSNPNTGGGSR